MKPGVYIPGDGPFLGIPRHMVSTPGAAENLVFQGWSGAWQSPADGHLDLAALPCYHLGEHAQRKGWQWQTDEVTDGMLITGSEVKIWKDELAAFGYLAESTHGIAHQVPAVLPVALGSMPNGSTAVIGAPDSFSGAPVLIMTPRADGNLGFFLLGMIGSNPDAAPDERQMPRPLIPAPVIKNAVAEFFQRLTTGPTPD